MRSVFGSGAGEENPERFLQHVCGGWTQWQNLLYHFHRVARLKDFQLSRDPFFGGTWHGFRGNCAPRTFGLPSDIPWGGREIAL